MSVPGKPLVLRIDAQTVIKTGLELKQDSYHKNPWVKDSFNGTWKDPFKGASKTYINFQIRYLSKCPWWREGWLSSLFKEKYSPQTTAEEILLLLHQMPFPPCHSKWSLKHLLLLAWHKVRQWYVFFLFYPLFFCCHFSILVVALCGFFHFSVFPDIFCHYCGNEHIKVLAEWPNPVSTCKNWMLKMKGRT